MNDKKLKPGRPRLYPKETKFIGVSITKEIRDELVAIGSMGDSYCVVIKQLIDEHNARKKK